MDEIRIRTITPTIPAAAAQPTGPAAGAAAGGGFRGLLKEALAEVNAAQLEAARAVDALAGGESQSLHQTMIALQRADVSFQLMMQVRNKIVGAYEDIQRMQI
jgi:flagellar hook-basal body complex protein FliE